VTLLPIVAIEAFSAVLPIKVTVPLLLTALVVKVMPEVDPLVLLIGQGCCCPSPRRCRSGRRQ